MTSSERRRLVGRTVFLCAVLAIGVLWLGVFPRLSRWTDAEQTLQNDKDAGIDRSAMFYTDHPRMLDSPTSRSAWDDGIR